MSAPAKRHYIVGETVLMEYQGRTRPCKVVSFQTAERTDEQGTVETITYTLQPMDMVVGTQSRQWLEPGEPT